MILRFFPDFPQMYGEVSGFALNRTSFMVPQKIFGRGYLFVSDFPIYIYKYI